ncbi:Aste57867_19793 [Aphanomyces stellatus]|uniref:histone acetyltransferase n=1 Tax=Aphanomyces stellatus TaxID=120398 RepID=A0A485LI11_9STRA|nr:hypothetical protein As57867_019728 [Aphanomyces stellatus]VFT96491.1 Aste57867_19793 [Aphanomyces stellatus]
MASSDDDVKREGINDKPLAMPAWLYDLPLPRDLLPQSTNPHMPAGANAPPMPSIATTMDDVHDVTTLQFKHARTCKDLSCRKHNCSKAKALCAHMATCADACCARVECLYAHHLVSHAHSCPNWICGVCDRKQSNVRHVYVLRRQQDWLCMLRHAYACTTATSCPKTYCVAMKRLWIHVRTCRVRECPTDHCRSSRYVLSHFKHCRLPACDLCVPVRRAIQFVDAAKSNPHLWHTIFPSCSLETKVLIRQMTNATMPATESIGKIAMLLPRPPAFAVQETGKPATHNRSKRKRE